MNEDRGPWYLLTGLILGVGLGLLIAWVIAPVMYINNEPGTLREEYKDRYRALIAAAYLSSGDVTRAQARLKLLGDTDMAGALIAQAQRSMVEGRPEAETRALSLLGLALSPGGPTPALNVPPTFTPPPSPTAEPSTPTPTITLTPSPVIAWTPTTNSSTSVTQATRQETPITPASTTTPEHPATATITATRTPTPGQPFVLKEKKSICDPDLPGPLIQVQAQDAAGHPVPGVEGRVYWDGGDDRFVTGLKPELGLGYADFTLIPGTTYTVQLADGGQPVRDLSAGECKDAAGVRYWGGWLLVFAQP